MIKICENTIDLISMPTVEDMREGDTFFILTKDYENEPFIMTDEEYFVRLTDGCAFKCDEYYEHLPVRKVNIDIIIRNV